MSITVREYRGRDARALADIYYDTIHRVNARDYSSAQISAWAPLEDRDDAEWMIRFARTHPFVAELRGQIAGFSELESNGHIDCFYCHHNHQRRGVGSALMNKILATAKEREVNKLYAEVSVTAKPFFDSFGFKVVRDGSVVLRGVSIRRILMQLELECTKGRRVSTDLFLARHRPLHEELIPELLDGLTEEHLRSRAHPGLPPIAWLLWHMARCEDVGANRLASGGIQVLESGRWLDRLGIPNRGHGTGMTDEAVDQLAGKIVLSELEAYRGAVAESTRRVARELPDHELESRLQQNYVHQVLFKEGVAGPGAEWIAPHYVGQTRGWCLMHCCLTHNFYHLGQAVLVKKLVTIPGVLR